MVKETALEFGFKYSVGDLLAHVAQVLDFGPAKDKSVLITAVNGAPRGYAGQAFVVLACHLELCSGGIQRTYVCRVADPAMITNAPQSLHEHELVPWADAIAMASASQGDEKKSD